ncbi:crotonase/enoyl-CoA hydratase family protein [Halopseudomonas sp.]|uniref:crotonase/enoyl-CoA hydratase family protein n=1 Tax=Halopseudomonas sp. TaxID=2901191 RepID=UPI00356170AA
MSALTYQVNNGLAEIAMDDGKVNALSEAMIGDLLVALSKAAEADLPVLIFGRSGCFSAGYDRRLIAAGGPASVAMRAAGDRLTLALLDHPAPLVIACTGHAMAKAGFMLLLADYRLGAAGGFRVSLNEVAIGMTMPDAAMALARERLAPTWLSRCALQAEALDPVQALAAGFLDELASPAQLLGKAREKLTTLAALDRRAYRESRQLLNAPLRAELVKLLALS